VYIFIYLKTLYRIARKASYPARQCKSPLVLSATIFQNIICLMIFQLLTKCNHFNLNASERAFGRLEVIKAIWITSHAKCTILSNQPSTYSCLGRKSCKIKLEKICKPASSESVSFLPVTLCSHEKFIHMLQLKSKVRVREIWDSIVLEVHFEFYSFFDRWCISEWNFLLWGSKFPCDWWKTELLKVWCHCVWQRQ
jgi:hypothetical protein